MDDKTLPSGPKLPHETAKAGTPNSRRISSRPVRSVLPWLPRFELSPLNARRWRNFKANRRGYWSLWIFLVLFVVTLFAEFIANDKPLFIHFDGKSYFPVFFTYPDTEFGDDLGTAADYRDPYTQKYLDEHNAIEIWPPIRFSYKTINDRPPSAFPVEADLDVERGRLRFRRQERLCPMRHAGNELARHRRPGPRRAGAADLRLSHFGSVRPGADHRLVDHRHRRRRGAGLFRRLDRPVVPALHRNLDLGAGALSAADHFLGAGARLLRAARHSAAVLLGAARRPGARRIPARPQFRIYPGGARARRLQQSHHVPPSACRTPWWRR